MKKCVGALHGPVATAELQHWKSRPQVEATLLERELGKAERVVWERAGPQQIRKAGGDSRVMGFRKGERGHRRGEAQNGSSNQKVGQRADALEERVLLGACGLQLSSNICRMEPSSRMPGGSSPAAFQALVLPWWTSTRACRNRCWDSRSKTTLARAEGTMTQMRIQGLSFEGGDGSERLHLQAAKRRRAAAGVGASPYKFKPPGKTRGAAILPDEAASDPSEREDDAPGV